MNKCIFLFLTLLLGANVNATTWVEVDDASKILWQMSAGGTVWFRNMNEFSSAHGGCCYSYKLDTTTPGGRSVWSTILAKMAAHKRITLGFPDVGTNSSVQTLNYIGRHSHATNE